ncbi:branched-chain amino acid ABC transporter permease [Lyngbya confervoides]|uniref:Branched-chain amino acid ABC transporter permease n=1 Tax=Lyngbya confervoides BDU141951 TaxID=1574623 RepID=A0ABD4T889_9CYAN|nr:branched-chain amino acid ABC transporter permease [Lyngbya confervoides]MCM1984999.1 branched-chain amino acid ABC transporter permease [Lyngbya confervoides BDU141951]
MVDYLVSSIAILTASFALFALGLNLQWGFTGLVNFGHVAFMTVGAYTTVLLSRAGVPLILAVGAGMILAAILGFIIGLSTLRLREDYLAIVTIGVSEVVRLIALNEEDITNGTKGVYNYPLPLESFDPNLWIRYGMALVLLGIAGFSTWLLWRWMVDQAQNTLETQPVRSRLRISSGFGSWLIMVGSTTFFFWLGVTVNLVFLLLSLVTISGGSACVFSQFRDPQRAFQRSTWGQFVTRASVTALVGLVGMVILAGVVSLIFNYSYKVGLMWLLVITVAFVFWRLEELVHSPWGRVLKAVREDEAVVKALGKDVFRYKMQSFMLGGAIAGLAGAFFAWNLTYINPDNFIPLVTFNAWIMVVLGGSGSNVGTLLGATIFWAYDSLTRFLLPALSLNSDQAGAFRVMVIGLLLIVLMIWRPQGILGKKEELTLGR